MRAVLLDVLGTLLRLEDPAPALRAELAARGIEVEEHESAAAIGAEIGYYLDHHMDGVTPEGLDDLRDRCAREIVRSLALPAERHPEVREAMLAALVFTPFEDAAPALRALRADGLTLVAASNWDCSLPEALGRAGLAAELDGAVSSAVAGAAKPAPAVFVAALELAGCTPEEAVFVGDSLENDVRGAAACGIRAVLLARDGEEPGGAEVIRSLGELPSLISSR
ncbi:MAG: HAD-IA family hydrolase [Thermoleophilaceae bacterium]